MNQNFTLTDHIDHLKAFKIFIGKSVCAVSHCQYFYNGKPDSEADGDLELKFDDESILTLSILGDGETMIAKAEPMNIPDSFTIEDNNKCSWKRISLNNKTKWKDIIGVNLVSIESMVDHWIDQRQKVLSGCKLTFSNGYYIVFCNAGDNARFTINDLSLVEKLEGVETEFISIT